MLRLLDERQIHEATRRRYQGGNISRNAVMTGHTIQASLEQASRASGSFSRLCQTTNTAVEEQAEEPLGRYFLFVLARDG